MAFDTLDTDAVATAGVVFSNGNLTAQGGAGATLLTSMAAQTLEGKKTGLWYVEFTCIAISGNVDGVGLVGSRGFQAGFLGNDPNGQAWGTFTNNHVVNAGGTVASVNAFTFGAGDVIGMAVDLTNARLWFNKNGSGTWCGASGTPNPATNTGGFSLANAVSGGCRVYPCINLAGSAAKFTINCGASAFTGAVPSGFTGGWTNTTVGTYFGSFATTGITGAASVNAPPASDKSVAKWVSALSGQLTDIVMAWGLGASNPYAVVYADSAGAPGALLGVSSIGAGGSGETSFAFSGVTVVSGTTYWIGMQAGAGGTPAIWCPPLASGIAFNANAGYPSPSNPFGGGPSTANFRYPMLAFVTTANPSTIAQTLTKPSQLGALTSTDAASIAQTLSKPSQLGALSATNTAAAIQTLTRLSQSGVLSEKDTAIIAQTLSRVTQSGVLAEKDTAMIVQVLSRVSQLAVDTIEIGVINQTLGRLSQQAYLNATPAYQRATFESMLISRVSHGLKR